MDVEKTVQFILEMQAQHAIAIQKLDEQMASHEGRMAALETSVTTVTDLVGRLAHAEIRLVERMEQLAGQMGDLGESQAHTDQRLNAMIDIVDKLIRRNGSPQ